MPGTGTHEGDGLDEQAADPRPDIVVAREADHCLGGVGSEPVPARGYGSTLRQVRRPGIRRGRYDADIGQAGRQRGECRFGIDGRVDRQFDVYRLYHAALEWHWP